MGTEVRGIAPPPPGDRSQRILACGWRPHVDMRQAFTLCVEGIVPSVAALLRGAERCRIATYAMRCMAYDVQNAPVHVSACY